MKQGKMVLLSLGLLLGVSSELLLQVGCSSDDGSSSLAETKTEKEEPKNDQTKKENKQNQGTQKQADSPSQDRGPSQSEKAGSAESVLTEILWKRQGQARELRHESTVKTEQGCLYQIQAKGPRAFSDYPLVNLGFPNASPVTVFEGDKELVQGNLKEIRGEDCLGAYRYSKTVVEISPTSKEVNPADLTMKMSNSLPLKRGKDNYWWLYSGTKNNIAAKMPKGWTQKKGTLNIEGHYLGAKSPSKLPQLMYNKKGHD